MAGVEAHLPLTHRPQTETPSRPRRACSVIMRLHGGGERGHLGAALCCCHRRKVHHSKRGHEEGGGAAGAGGAVGGAAVAAAAAGGAATTSQRTRSVHTGTRVARKATRLGLVLYALHPLMLSLKCTNFTTAARSSPDRVSSPLSPQRSLTAAAATSACMSSRAAAPSAAAVSLSAFARMAVWVGG
jgi:hypothetical protein